MTHGLYFRLAYTWAHAIDDGQDALVSGRPALVQNSYSPNAERGTSAIDQRHRFVFSWIAEPAPIPAGHGLLETLFNRWKISNIVTFGSGRPLDARVLGDPNQDDNTANDRLPGVARNSFVGPDYVTTDLRLAREIHLGDRTKLVPLVESFNLLNHFNGRVTITDDGFQNSAAQFLQIDKRLGLSYFPGQYRSVANFLRPTDAYAPRQVQFGLRLVF